MPYKGQVAELLAGDAGMVRRPSRLKAQPEELFDAQGVTFEDQLLRREAGSVQFGAGGIAGAPAFAYTLSGAAHWVSGLATFRINTTTPTVAEVGTGTGQAKGGSPPTFVTITVGVSGVSAGQLVVIGCAYKTPLGVDPVASCQDVKGNSYTKINNLIHTSGLNFIGHCQFYSVLGTGLVNGDQIKVTVSSATLTDVRLIAVQSNGAVASPDPLDRSGVTKSSGTSSAVSVGPLQPLQQVPELLIGSVADDLSSGSGTAGAGFTKVDEVVSSAAGVALAYRVDTTTPTIIGLYDWNPTFIAAGAGTVTVSKGGQTVTGVSTTFLSSVNIGDSIQIANETHRVLSVASNTSLTVAEPWLVAASGSAYSILKEQRLVTATSDGAIYQELLGKIDNTSLKSGLTPAIEPGRFVAGGKETGPANARKLFWFSGRDAVQVINGNTDGVAAVATPPADWSGANQPTNGIVFRNRLVGFGNANYPHQLYISDPSNHENFTNANATFQTIDAGIGNRLWCAAVFQGILWVWKYPRGIWYLDDSDIIPGNWVTRIKSAYLGCAPSPYAVCPMDDDVLFMAPNGAFHLLSAVDTLGGTRASDLSYRLGINPWLRDNINLTRLRQVVSVWYPHKKQAIFAVPRAGSQNNDLILRFDFAGTETGEASVRFGYSGRDAAAALAIRRDYNLAGLGYNDGVERLITGEAGFVFLADQVLRDKNGQPYLSQYQTPHLDFTHVTPAARTRRKIFEHLEVIFEPVNAGTLTIQPVVDGQPSGPPMTFDATKRRVRKRMNVADGHTLSLIGSNSAVDEDFQVLAHEVSFELGDEDQSRGNR